MIRATTPWGQPILIQAYHWDRYLVRLEQPVQRRRLALLLTASFGPTWGCLGYQDGDQELIVTLNLDRAEAPTLVPGVSSIQPTTRLLPDTWKVSHAEPPPVPHRPEKRASRRR